uniref:Uncharacterized protein n=1 Tax=Oryza rufipogon TaxID=4529 RepID=A0A0E0QXQ6_ORYRU
MPRKPPPPGTPPAAATPAASVGDASRRHGGRPTAAAQAAAAAGDDSQHRFPSASRRGRRRRRGSASSTRGGARGLFGKGGRIGQSRAATTPCGRTGHALRCTCYGRHGCVSNCLLVGLCETEHQSPIGRRLPPGSRGFPIIGETLEFLTESPANQLPAFFKRRLDR